MTTEADRARAEVQAAVLRALEGVRDWCGPFGYPGVASWVQSRDEHIKAALSDTAALDRMLAEARADERERLARLLESSAGASPDVAAEWAIVGRRHAARIVRTNSDDPNGIARAEGEGRPK